MSNGFFQLIHNAHGTSLKIVPPTKGGEMFPITELSDYLNARNIRFDLHKLNATCLGLKEKIEIPLGMEMGYRESEKCIVRTVEPVYQMWLTFVRSVGQKLKNKKK